MKSTKLTKYHCGLLSFHGFKSNHSHYILVLETPDSVEFFNNKTQEMFTLDKYEYDRWREIMKGMRL